MKWLFLFPFFSSPVGLKERVYREDFKFRSLDHLSQAQLFFSSFSKRWSFAFSEAPFHDPGGRRSFFPPSLFFFLSSFPDVNALFPLFVSLRRNKGAISLHSTHVLVECFHDRSLLVPSSPRVARFLLPQRKEFFGFPFSFPLLQEDLPLVRVRRFLLL